MRYRFLKERRGEYGSGRKACKISIISESGCCEYPGKRKSNQQIEREALEGFAENAFIERRGRRGYRWINH